MASAGIPAPTTKRILGVLQAAEVLRTLVLGGGRQATVLEFPALLDITEGREVFCACQPLRCSAALQTNLWTNNGDK